MNMIDLMTVVNSDPMVPLNEGGVKIVKSIQRGLFCGTINLSVPSDVTIGINTVDPSKCVVLIDGNARVYMPGSSSNTGHKTLTLAILNTLTENTLVISPNDSGTPNGADAGSPLKGNWQIIEFY